jgi:HPt (histidine-containing phosphotransfer) domain-containing protein
LFDRDVALIRCFNNPELLAEMIQCFFDEIDSLFPQMRSALERNDLAEVGRLGHRLKGTVIYLGAESVGQAAVRVERFERPGGQLADAEKAVQALAQQCEILANTLALYRSAADPKDVDERARGSQSPNKI